MDRVWRRLSATLSRRAGSLFRHHRFGLYILAVLVGLASGLGAVLFRLGIDAWSQLLSGADDYTVSMGPSVGLLAPLGTWFVLVTPMLSGLLTGPLMSRLGRTPTGHGVAGVIWSTRHGDGTMAPLPALAATTSAALTIGGGGSVGPEGPIAELGASTASIIGRGLRLRRSSIRHLAAAGTAAGIASAFNAPLAGAFFALEVILMGFSADAFIVIVLACVSSTVLSHHLLGTTLSLSLPYLDLSGDAQLGWVTLLGLVGGGVGIGFMRLRFVILDALTRAWQRLGVPIWARPGIGGLAVGATLLVLPEMYGESSAALNRALAGRYALTLLLVLCVAKMLATSLTLGMGFVGGVFAPSLFIGGTLGAAFGTLVAPSYAPAAGVFGVIGMGAVFAGAARAPMTAVLLIIEMTGQHALLVPLMLATVADLSLVRDRLDGKDEATDVLQALTDTRLEGLPVVARAAGSGAEELVGWVSQRIVVERVYEAQAQARTAAATYTSWGSRLQDRWHSRPVPRRRIGRISRISRVSSRSSRRSRRR